MSNLMLGAKLIFNAFRYRLLRITGWPGKLQSISLEVTHRCMCHCVMCNIWKIPRDVADLTFAEITTLLSSPCTGTLREIDITGGEPFLRDDLLSLLTWIAKSKRENFPDLQTVAITSNCILTEKIISISTEVIKLFATQGIDLVIVCGLDAANDLHDKIRNYKNAWKKVSATLEGLELLRQQNPNLIIGLKTTIIPQNVRELDDLAAFANKHGLFTIVSPRIITPNRFGNENLQQDLTFSNEDIQKIKQFYAGPAFAWSGHKEAMLNYFATGIINKPCSAGFNTVFVRHTGEVFPCPLIPFSLGNIKKTSLCELIISAKASRFRKSIKLFNECKTCTEPGLERLAWTYEGFVCLRHFVKSPAKFHKLLKHMGIDKLL